MGRQEWLEAEKRRWFKQNRGDHEAIVARKVYHIVERLLLLYFSIAIPIDYIVADQVVAEDDPA